MALADLTASHSAVAEPLLVVIEDEVQVHSDNSDATPLFSSDVAPVMVAAATPELLHAVHGNVAGAPEIAEPVRRDRAAALSSAATEDDDRARISAAFVRTTPTAGASDARPIRKTGVRGPLVLSWERKPRDLVPRCIYRRHAGGGCHHAAQPEHDQRLRRDQCD